MKILERYKCDNPWILEKKLFKTNKICINKLFLPRDISKNKVWFELKVIFSEN